jgi:3-oxoacyl-[acyl-carrier protein] reductase
MKILITGGASGLGEAISRKLVLLPQAEVTITYSSSEAKALALQREFPNLKAVKCNFADTGEIQHLLNLIAKDGLDVLVNNAHSTAINKLHFHKLGLEVFEKSFLHNILPTMSITQAAINVFRQKKYGRIITILSASLLNKPPMGYSEYTATKAYLHSLTKSWATENAGFNITSNCVSPAFMQTKLTSDVDERIVEEMQNKHPLKKILSPVEVAEIVAFLCTTTQQLNGVNIPVNSADNIAG